MGSWSEVIDYCRTSMAFEGRERFRVLFLDKKNGLIADEVQGSGTVDHTPVYPREVIRRAWNCPRRRLFSFTTTLPAIRRRQRKTSR